MKIKVLLFVLLVSILTGCGGQSYYRDSRYYDDYNRPRQNVTNKYYINPTAKPTPKKKTYKKVTPKPTKKKYRIKKKTTKKKVDLRKRR